MQYKYRIRLAQQLLLLAPVLLKNGFLFFIYLYFFGMTMPVVGFVYLLAFIIVFDILPTLIIHIQYLYCNWKAGFTINTAMKYFIYQTPSRQLKYAFSDILRITHYASYGGGSGIYSFAEYRYYKITLNDKTEIVVTCLMINDIKNTIERQLEANAEKQLRIIAFIY